MPLSEETRAKIARELENYPRRRSAYLPALRLAQAEVGYLGPETLGEVGDLIDADPNALAMLVTFYDLLFGEPVGQKVLGVCDGFSCRLVGSFDVIEALKERLGVDFDGTSADGAFTLKRMECLAACQLGPCMIVNTDSYVGNLKPDNLAATLAWLRQQATVGDHGPWLESHIDARVVAGGSASQDTGQGKVS